MSFILRANKEESKKRSQKRSKEISLILSISAAIALLVSGCAFFREKTGAEVMMDTYITYSLVADSDKTNDSVYSDMVTCGKKLEERLLSRYEGESEIAQINASAGSTEGYPLSEKMEEYISSCLEVSEKTDGAFDITIGALSNLWGIDDAAKNGGEGFVVPSKEAIDEALSHCGYEKVKIQDHRIYLPEGMILDLGAVGKGIYLDEISNHKDDLKCGLVSAGGSILTIGRKINGDMWTIGIKDPFKPEEMIYKFQTAGNFVVSTSGSYERFVEVNGERYHHIIDPKTGYPANSDLASATVVMTGGDGRGLLSDALSTAVFVLGKEKGLELAKEYQCNVIVVKENGDVIES